ncbi:ComEA family DNA-binding protein [Brevibacillus fluminis]|uniref:ComEA family DNA-binding protein n=1 Tax=Brevibacillus fluminis TaxID=511487 RepID=A0A3M8D346_9BACL|nr:helix-hairpin-helix domain-containing protein [Brevibacillus fluminis]RNB82333.1 ComEA family DNA-binding protein [Brevibacillus fluminis]
MLMELWDRHRRVWIILLALLFLSLSFYFYYTSGDEGQGLPLRPPVYSTEMDQPTNVTGPDSVVASSRKADPVQTSLTSGSGQQQPSVAEAVFTSLSPAESSRTDAKVKTMYVDVKGQVKQPGIYPFTDNERIADAIEKAGGFLPSADPLQVNLAQHLADGMYIIVPAKGGQAVAASPLPLIATTGGGTTGSTGGVGGSSGNSSTSAGVESSGTSSRATTVNLNTATADQLATLPGIGITRAEAILAYREQHGKFTKIEQLKNISGIGDKMFEKLKGKISVD